MRETLNPCPLCGAVCKTADAPDEQGELVGIVMCMECGYRVYPFYKHGISRCPARTGHQNVELYERISRLVMERTGTLLLRVNMRECPLRCKSGGKEYCGYLSRLTDNVCKSDAISERCPLSANTIYLMSVHDRRR